MQPFPLLCLTLVRTSQLALTRPPCHRLRRSPKSSKPCLRVRPLTRTSRARDGSKDAEVPSKRRGSPLGLLSCGCLENGVAIHMGIMRSRYERSFLPIPSPGSFAYAFANRRQPANPSIGPVLFHQRVELLPREVLQQLMKNAIVMAHGIDPQLVSGSFPNNPGPVESMPCAMYSKNVPDSRAAMPSVVVELTYDRKGSA